MSGGRQRDQAAGGQSHCLGVGGRWLGPQLEQLLVVKETLRVLQLNKQVLSRVGFGEITRTLFLVDRVLYTFWGELGGLKAGAFYPIGLRC